MASIISAGIGSGLDIAGIVQQLVAAEGEPVESRLGQQEFRAQAKLSAFGSLKSALSTLRDNLDVMQSLDQFLSRKASSSDDAIFTASAGSSALPANYTVDVLQLAQAQKLTSGAFATSDTVIGTGTLSIAMGATSMDLEISAENNTLAGIRDAINDSIENPGVAATIVNADSGSYLIVSGESTGAANSITITQTGGDGGLSALEFDPGNGLASMTETIAPQDAQIQIDGLDVVNSSNTFSGAVEGVTIDVLQVTNGSSQQLNVENDNSAAKTLITEFVDSYNALISTFDALSAFDTNTEAAAPLIGDSTLRGIRDQVRREMSTAVQDIDATFSMLSDIGIEVQLDGKVSIEETRLDAALADDFVKVGQLFATTDGFATRLFTLSEGFLESDGILESRTQGLNATIENINDDRSALNERLASLETRLLRQFNALDSLLAQLSSTSNFLAQQLDNLPGVSRPNSSS